MIREISNKCREELITTIEQILDTRDKRYMFIRMEFKDLLSKIDLEGSSNQVAWNIYFEFEKQSMIGSLIAALNAKLDTNIILEIKK